MKTIGSLRKSRFIGIAKTQLAAYLVGAAYNLLRMARLVGYREQSWPVVKPSMSPNRCRAVRTCL